MNVNKSEILKKIKKIVSDIYPNAIVILYGSKIRGEDTEYSDWDILILIDEEVTNDIEKIIKYPLYELEWEI